MKAAWLIDADLFDRYRDRLVVAIRESGREVKLIHAPRPGYSWDDEGCSYRKTFPKDGCVIVHGDIELCSRVAREQRWKPGSFATVENYSCSTYFCHFGGELLNRDYVMLPFGELERCADFLFRTVGVDDVIFVRPDSPLKLFTGQTATRGTLTDDL